MDKDLWHHFTGKTGINSSFRDAYERNTFLLNQSANQFEPIVSNYLFNSGFRPTYPEGKRFAVCLSHDIDELFIKSKSKIKRSAEAWMAKDYKKSLSHASTLSNRQIHFEFRLENLLEIEQKYGASSSMYFLSLLKGEEDFNYDLSEIQAVLEFIKSTGNEIGLHGGHKAYNDINKLKEEKERLEKAIGQQVIGYRNHYLRFTEPLTWENLAVVGFNYDTTYAYPDCVGFRNGMCYPYRPYNLEKNDFVDLVEVPLMVMDVTLTRTMRLSTEGAFDLCKSLIQKVKSINGVFTILWHNCQDDINDMKLYDKLLEYANGEGAWLTSTDKVVDWWKEMDYINQVEQHLKFN